MALKLSTALRNFLLGEGTLRKAFEDGILNIYSGAAPTNADDAVTGVLLAKITKASGAVVANARSQSQIGVITITSHAPGETFVVPVTVDGVGPTSYTFTNTPDAGGVDAVALKVAEMLNDIPQLSAIAAGTTGVIHVTHRIAGGSFTLGAAGGTGTYTVTSAALAATLLNTLQLGVSAAGVIAKTVDVWSGVGLAAGTAGYFRLVTNLDTGGLVTVTEPRLQGNIATSGAELNLSNLNIVVGATQTIDTFSLTEPAS